MVRRIVLAVLSISLFCVPSAHAASIFLPDLSNALFAQVFNPAGDPPPTSVVFDFAGDAAGTVYDTVAATALGNSGAAASPADPDTGADIVLGTATPAVLDITFL